MEHRTVTGRAIDRPVGEESISLKNQPSSSDTSPEVLQLLNDRIALLETNLNKSYANNIRLRKKYNKTLRLLEEDEEECQGVEDAETEKLGLEKELKDAKEKLTEAEKKIVEMKKILDLDEHANHQLVMDRIQEYTVGKKLTKAKLDKALKDYTSLNEEKKKLVQEVEILNLTIRQQADEHETKKQMKKTDQLAARRSARSANEVRPSYNMSRVSNDTNLVIAYKGCVFCKEPIGPGTAHAVPEFCRIHHRILESGKYPCCGGKANAAGCVEMPHMKVNMSGGKVQLVNEKKTIDLM